MKRTVWISFAAIAVLLAPACTNKQAETEQDVTITVNLTDQAGLTDINPPQTILIPTMVLISSLKNPDATNPAGFADVQLNTYTVHYRRADGGTLVPPDQIFAAGHSIATPGTDTLTNFPILSQTAVQQSPFDQLFPFNGGIDRETGSNEIRMFYDVTFFGQTVAGQRVRSETATGLRVFIYQ